MRPNKFSEQTIDELVRSVATTFSFFGNNAEELSNIDGALDVIDQIAWTIELIAADKKGRNIVQNLGATIQ